MKQFFLTREKTFVECEIIESSAHKRKIKLLEGDRAGKVITVHPQGVAWGGIYPRVFESDTKPTKFFVHKGRAIVSQANTLAQTDPNSIPQEKKGYRFQNFLVDVVDSIHSQQNVLLTGGTGVGKTTHITQLAARIDQPMLRINFNGETRMSDLIGKVQVIAGETRWVDGVLPMAMRNGYWLLLDELDFADPAVLSLLHPVLEDDPVLVLKENAGQIIRPHPNFRLFATANSIGAMSDRASSYSGTNQMNEAFLDRWQVLMVDNLSAKEEIRVIKDESPALKSKWVKQIVDFANKARVKDDDGDNSIGYSGDNFSTRKTIAWAKKAALHRCPVKGAKLAWLDKMPPSEQEVMLQALATVFGQSKTRAKSAGVGMKKRSIKAASVQMATTKGLSSLTQLPGVVKKRGRPRKNMTPV